MNLDKQTRAKVQEFVHAHHNTEWFPCNDAFVIEYYGKPIFTITDGHVVIEAPRKNWTTFCRIKELLSIFGITASLDISYREWIISYPSGKSEPFGDRYVINRYKKPKLKVRSIE